MQESGWPDFTYETLVDVKARAGFAMDRALFYVAGGYSFARFDEEGDEDGDDLDDGASSTSDDDDDDLDI